MALVQTEEEETDSREEYGQVSQKDGIAHEQLVLVRLQPSRLVQLHPTAVQPIRSGIQQLEVRSLVPAARASTVNHSRVLAHMDPINQLW